MDLKLNVSEKIKIFTKVVLTFISVLLFAMFIQQYTKDVKKPEVLKDYKDGIQNHLVWDVKGQCFFVRPNDDVTTYLIRVADCDKK